MAVNRFNNPLRQRLVAAGASPQRADAFVQQKAFESGAPVGMPSVAGKPKGPNEWYNEDYANASASLYPKGFRPPTPDSPNFKQYFDFVYGKGSYDKLSSKALAQEAPLWSAATRSSSMLDKAIVQAITQKNASIGEITESLLGATNAALLGGRTPQQAVDYAEKVFNDYNNAKAKIVDVYGKEIAKNKDYKYGLPDPKLRYGTTTDLSKGTVDILTNPTAAKAYAAYTKTLQGDRMAAQKASQYLAALVAEANKRQITPWKDEAKRRDYLKGKKIGG